MLALIQSRFGFHIRVPFCYQIFRFSNKSHSDFLLIMVHVFCLLRKENEISIELNAGYSVVFFHEKAKFPISKYGLLIIESKMDENDISNRFSGTHNVCCPEPNQEDSIVFVNLINT